MAPPLSGLMCGGRFVGNLVTLLVSAGVVLVESSGGDVPGVPGGEVDAAALGGSPAVAPGGMDHQDPWLAS